MTNLVPHDIEEWMRTMERNYRDLAGRRFVSPALSNVTPRFSHTLSANLTTTSGTHYFLEFNTADAAPEHDVGNPAFMSYSLVGSDPRYVANIAGLYSIRVNVQWAGGAANTNRKVHIFKGSQTTPWYSIEHAAVGGAGCMAVNAGHLALQAGEYFRIGAYQASGGDVPIFFNSGDITGSGGRGPSRLTVIPAGAYTV